MNFVLEQKKKKEENMPLSQFTPALRINVDHSLVVSYLANIVQGEGGMFYLGFGYSKIRQKRSTVSSVLQPTVAL